MAHQVDALFAILHLPRVNLAAFSVRREMSAEVSEVLKQAWDAVEAANLPSEIQAVAFREAVRLMSPAEAASAGAHTQGGTARSGGSGGAGGSGSGSSKGATGSGSANAITVDEAEIYARVAEQTGVDREKLEELVHLDDGVLKISIPGIKLGTNNAEKTRSIAQILTIVRGFGLEEHETSVELIRAEAQRLKCYDSANFSSHLGKLRGGYLITGTGINRRIRAKAGGIHAFPDLVDSILSDS
jgi:hypothetical protein